MNNAAIEKITAEIGKLKSIVDELKCLSHEIPALDRNLVRIASSIKMLELNFADIGSEDG